MKLKDQLPFRCLLLVSIIQTLFFLPTVRPQPDPTKLAFIRNLTLSTWQQTRSTTNATLRVRFHAVQSLSTLFLMNLTAEYTDGKHWALSEYAPLDGPVERVSVSDLVTLHLGSVLSCYALTNDSSLSNYAAKEGVLVKQAYLDFGDTPFQYILYDGTTFGFQPAEEADPPPDYGTQLLELHYLRDLTNDLDLTRVLDLINSHIATKTTDDMTSSLYWSLVNRYLQSNGTDTAALEMYRKEMDTAEATGQIGHIFRMKRLHLQAEDRKRRWLFDFRYCNLGGLWATGARALMEALLADPSASFEEIQSAKRRIEKHWNWAVEITELCHAMASHPETVLFPPPEKGGVLSGQSKGGLHICSYLAKSYFFLYRYSGNTKYQQYAWQLAQSIDRHLHLQDLPTPTALPPDDFIATTLKYLYLTFTEPNAHHLPLDQWVLTATGQPLPIRGRNRMYSSV